MKSLCIDKYIANYLYKNQEQLDKFVDFIQKYCEKIEHKIIKASDNVTIKLLYEYMYIIDVIYKNIGLMQLVSNNTNLKDADKRIEIMIDKFFKNEEIFEKLSKLNTDERILKKFILNTNPATRSTLKNIKILENRIQSQLNDPTIIKPTLEIKQQIINIPNELHLTRQTYYSMQRQIRDPNVRKYIEEIYYNKSNMLLESLSKLIIERHKYSILSGHTSYFNLIKKKSDDVKLLLEDLMNKINEKSKKEIERIHRELTRDGYNKKVDVSDIIYYYEKLKTKILFSPDHVIKTLFKISKQYFNITFENINYTDLWNNNVLTYKVCFKTKFLGYIHIDLKQCENKTLTSPTCISLCQTYINIDNKTIPTRVAIIGNYISMNDKCMSFSDTNYLFKEFGYALQLLLNKTTAGIYFNNEFSSLMPQVFECIIWEFNTVELLCSNETIPNLVDNIIFTRHLHFASSIQLKCVNALFDHILHNSPELMKILKTTDQHQNILLSVYKKTYENILCYQGNIMNLNISGINPTLIQQEINGSEGTLYFNIFIDILSFSVFQLIKEGKGEKFITDVLYSDQLKIKKLLDSFISQLQNDNCYDLYLRDLINYNEIDTELNNTINKKITNTNITETSANQFNEYSDDDTVENIIIIDRKL